MSSSKKKQIKKLSTEGKASNKAKAKINRNIPSYAKWTAAAAVFLISLVISLLMTYGFGFGICFGFINAVFAYIAAEFMRNESFAPFGRDLFNDKKQLVVMSGIMSALSVLLMYAVIGVYPFGNMTVVAGDMSSEYLPFAVARNRAVLSGGSLIYSDRLGLGGGFWSVLMYNVASPFMLLSLPIGVENMPEFMLAMQVLRMGASGGAFAYFYMEKYKRNDVSACVFSLIYALTTYAVSNMLNIIWADCFVLFPLIVLGLERILQKKSPLLYVICLSVAMVSNYYIAFIICIYLVLYFAVYIALNETKFELKPLLCKLGVFGAASLLSAGLACICLVPSAVALTQTTGNNWEFERLSFWRYNPLELFGKFLWGSSLDYSNDTRPNVYCSIFAVVMLAFFWLCRRVELKKKLTYSALLGILIISTLSAYLDYAWHGFHVTVGLPYRYSFLISFTILLMLTEVWQFVTELDFNRIMGVVGAFTVIILANYMISEEKSLQVFAISLTLVLLVAGAVGLRVSGVISQNGFAVLAVLLVFSDLTMNGIDTLYKVDDANKYWTKEQYSSMLEMNEVLAARILEADDGVYRVDDENFLVDNQCVYFDYPSLSSYATPTNGNALRLMSALGYADDFINKYSFNLYTPFSDSLLNLKYIMSGDSSERNHLRLTDISNMGKNVYENELALPRAFAVANEAEAWSIEQDDPFVVQNQLGLLASGEEQGVYDILKRKGDEEYHSDFVIKGGRYIAEYEMPRDGELFCFFGCLDSKGIKLTLGEKSYNLDGSLSCVFPLYGVKKGETLRIEFFGEDGLSGVVSAALQNEAALERTIGKLAEYPIKIDNYSSGRLEGSLTVEQDCLLFTSIPCESGWHAELDGNAAEIVEIGGSLIGLRLHSGENHIKLVYRPKALYVGAMLSALSLIVLILILILRKRRFVKL